MRQKIRLSYPLIVTLIFLIVLNPTYKGNAMGRTNIDSTKTSFKQSRSNLKFTQNIGQLDDRVLYHANDLQANHYFLNNEILSVVTKKAKKQPQKDKNKKVNRKRGNGQNAEHEEKSVDSTYTYGIRFIGTKGHSNIKAQKKLDESFGHLNHIKGGGHYKDIPQYSSINYQEIWRGIDAAFYEQDGQLKYDFIVSPGSNPSKIKFTMDGVDDLHADEKTGELLFKTPWGQLKKGRPFTYQLINEEKIVIDAKYRINGNIISFEIGKYDTDYPLIVDPVALKYATFLGGSSNDYLQDIYVHPTSNNIYLTGYTNSVSFPGVVGNATSSYDGFITCMSPDGSSVLWTTIIGGDESSENLFKIHVSDDENDIFVTGNSNSSDYPTNGILAPYAANIAGSNNPIISRLSGDGTILKYSTFFPVESWAEERYTVIGDLVYGATYYDDNDADNYPITMPAGAYQPNPLSDDGSTSEIGQILFAINTAIGGAASFQYGTFWYDDTPGSYSYMEFSNSGSDAAGNFYLGGYIDVGEPISGPIGLFPANAMISIDKIHQTLTPNGYYSLVGWVAQFDPTLSNLIYATPILPILHDNYLEIANYSYAFDMHVTSNGDIYTAHADEYYDVDLNNIEFAPNVGVKNLQPLTINSGDDLLISTVTKIAAADRSQFEFITTAGGSYYGEEAGQIFVDDQGKIHWLFQRDVSDLNLESLHTEGALQEIVTSRSQTQYAVLTSSGTLDYATIIGPSIDFNNSTMDNVGTAIFVSSNGEAYIGGYVEQEAQVSFPVTPSYWNTDSGSQVFVYDATPDNTVESWLAVFHQPPPSDNTINDFAPGNNTFCVNSLIYQDPNYGPIIGQPIDFVSGDGSSSAHVLPDIRPSPFTEAHPNPDAGSSLRWEISYNGGITWLPLANSDVESYSPLAESSAGTVQYRRIYSFGASGTESVSNIASANIVGSLTLDLQSPNTPVYFCPGTLEDFTFNIAGASGNISWQWYNGFAPVDNSIINPSSGSGTVSSFTATLPSSVSTGGYYRIVVEDGTGCAKEAFVTFIPLSQDAGALPVMAICPGNIANEVTIGPQRPNPNFDYSWTGPSGFVSNLSNPVVSLNGTYSLQVRLSGDPSFCVGGQTSVDVLPLVAHDPALIDTSIFMTFCQDDSPIQIGLNGPAPIGYAFQWSPGISLDNSTAFNPTYNPSTLAFGPPTSDVNYTFTALRLSDGCIFEETISISTTALAEADAGNNENIYCANFHTIGGNGTTGDYFEWRAVATSYAGGIPALTSSPDFSMDGSPANLGTSKFLTMGVPYDTTTCFYIDYELLSSYAPFPNTCLAVDTVRINVCPCGGGATFICPDITTSNVAGSAGVCDLADNIISVVGFSGASYTWTTYSVDGVIQPPGTEPRGLFEIENGTIGDSLTATGPHPLSVISELQNIDWGWPSASVVVYEVTATAYINNTLESCTEQIQVFSSITGVPVVDINNLDICIAGSQGELITGTGINLPYQITGTDYNTAPNSSLDWIWTGGPITSGQNTPFPILNPTETTTYSIYAIDPVTGCFDLDSMDVIIHEIEADAGANVSQACPGSLIQIGANSRSNYTYQWTPTSGLNYPIGTPNATVSNPYLVVPSTLSEYVIRSTESNTGCQSIDTIVITPGTIPPAPPAADTIQACPSQQIRIGKIYSPATGISFDWTAGTGANLSWLDLTDANQVNVSLPPTFTGTATFTLTVTNGTCGSASADYLIISEVADVTLGADITATCVTPLVQIGSGSATNGFIYTWTPQDGLYTDTAGTIPYSGENLNSVFAKPLINTEYTLIASNPSTGCLFTDNIIVDSPAGIDVDGGGDQIICPGTTSLQLGQSGSGIITWSATGYSSDPDGTLSVPTPAEESTMLGYLSSTSVININFSQGLRSPGKFQYQVQADYGGGCIATDHVIIIVSNLNEGLAGNSKVMCPGESRSLGMSPVSGVSYNWEIINPTSLSGDIIGPNTSNPIVNPEETTTYRLTYTDLLTDCEIVEIVEVVVLQGPDIDNATIGPLCGPISVQDLTSSIANYTTLSNATWYENYVGGNLILNPTAVQPSVSTDYFLIGEIPNGCIKEVKVSLTIDNPAEPSVISNEELGCLDPTIDLEDYEPSLSNPSNFFEWHSADNTNTATLITDKIVGAGDYYLFEISTNGCESGSGHLNVSTSCTEICDDGIDNDSNGLIDDGCTCNTATINPHIMYYRK